MSRIGRKPVPLPDAVTVAVDAEEDDAALIATAPYGYLRLRRPDYDAAALSDWAMRIADQDWNEAFVFFKHEDDGAGPRMAADFVAAAERLGELRRPAKVRRPTEAEERDAG